MIKVCPNELMQYANRECNAIMTIAKCTNTAASSNDSNHHSSTPAAWFASGTALKPLITGDAIRISGVGNLGVAIQSLVLQPVVIVAAISTSVPDLVLVSKSAQTLC